MAYINYDSLETGSKVTYNFPGEEEVKGTVECNFPYDTYYINVEDSNHDNDYPFTVLGLDKTLVIVKITGSSNYDGVFPELNETNFKKLVKYLEEAAVEKFGKIDNYEECKETTIKTEPCVKISVRKRKISLNFKI